MKRIFIAIKIEPGETLSGMIYALKTGLRKDDIKWTNPGNIHITLSFLGDTEEEMIRAVSTMLKEKCEGFGKFELIIKGSGVFKSLAEPRVIWTGIEPSPELVHLNELIKNGLKNTGIRIEDRPFNPHLTLGRIKSIKDKNVLKSVLDKYQNLEIQKTVIDEVILFESILLNTSPVYKPISKYKL
jgi:RNA 2',3'-cyclic 3'-phosphodiesterase